MARFRFTIAGLLGLVLFSAVGVAALRASDDLWDAGLFTLTLGLLALAVLLAVHRRGRRRAFWMGFALVGGLYLGASLVPPIESRLLSTKGLAYLDAKLPRDTPEGLAFFDYDGDGNLDLYVANTSNADTIILNAGDGTFRNRTSAAGQNSVNGPVEVWRGLKWLSPARSRGSTENFVRIGHSLLALIAAYLGGLVSRRLKSSGEWRVARGVGPLDSPLATRHSPLPHRPEATPSQPARS
jgi:hypothetical protein